MATVGQSPGLLELDDPAGARADGRKATPRAAAATDKQTRPRRLSGSDGEGSAAGEDSEGGTRKRRRSARGQRAERVETPEESRDQRREEAHDENDDDDDGDDGDEDEVFEVEAILDHKGRGASLKYLLKWKGYPSSSNTWESAKGLSCEELIQEYWEMKKKGKTSYKAALPFTPVAPAGGKKYRGRRLAADGSEKDDDAEGESGDFDPDRRGPDAVTMNEPVADTRTTFVDSDGIQSDFRVPPYRQWEEKAFRIVSVEQSDDGLVGEIEWYPGVCTIHPTSLIREHCPRKLVDFYELRLRFVKDDD